MVRVTVGRAVTTSLGINPTASGGLDCPHNAGSRSRRSGGLTPRALAALRRRGRREARLVLQLVQGLERAGAVRAEPVAVGNRSPDFAARPSSHSSTPRKHNPHHRRFRPHLLQVLEGLPELQVGVCVQRVHLLPVGQRSVQNWAGGCQVTHTCVLASAARARTSGARAPRWRPQPRTPRPWSQGRSCLRACAAASGRCQTRGRAF